MSERPEWDLIHTYSRRQAIEDGVLVDLMQGELEMLVREAGFRRPLAMTRAAFDSYVNLTQAAEAAGNDIKGRLWDILVMLRQAIRRETARHPDTDTVLFDFLCVVDEPRPTQHRLKASIGPDDDGQPCFTLMLPEED